MCAQIIERRRAFVIETGQIEGLYTLKRGITEQLITEGPETAVSSHTLENIDNKTIKGLLQDQETVTGLRVEGGRVIRVQVTFERKGVCKLHSNKPKRFDGIVHDYCPPEHVQSEMDRLLDYYRDIDKKHISTHVEAAWLHHRFVRTHPFQDGPEREIED